MLRVNNCFIFLFSLQDKPLLYFVSSFHIVNYSVLKKITYHMISYFIVPFNIERLISHFLLVIYPIIIFSGKYDFSLIENKSSSHELSLSMIVSMFSRRGSSSHQYCQRNKCNLIFDWILYLQVFLTEYIHRSAKL